MRADHGLERDGGPADVLAQHSQTGCCVLRACARVALSRWLGGKIRHVPCRPFDASQ